MFWIVIIIIIGICYYLGKDSSPSTKYQAGTLLMLGDKTADNKLDEIELKQVSMRLNPKESCYYEGVGKAYNSKDIVTGYDRTSNGYSVSPYIIRLAKVPLFVRQLPKNTLVGYSLQIIELYFLRNVMDSILISITYPI